MSSRSHLLFCFALPLTLVASCSSSSEDASTCATGEKLACSCAGGGSGFRVCQGGVYGACDCQATLVDAGTGDVSIALDAIQGPVDANADQGSPDGDALLSDAPTLLPLYSACTADGQCDSGFCFLYNNGKQACTKTCTTSADCPAPSTGCNAKGVCKDVM